MGAVNYPYEGMKLTDASGNIINPAKEDGNLATLAGTVQGGKVQVSSTSAPTFYTRQDTYTAPASGVTVDAHAAPVDNFGVLVKGTGGAATAWEVVLEASLDNVNFTTILDHVTGIGDGQHMWTGELKSPALYFRTRLVSVTLGSASNLVVTMLGM